MSNARFLKNVICVFDIHIKRIFFCRSQVVLLVRDLSQLRNILGWACTAYTSEPLLQFLQISCLNIFVQLHIFSTADNILLVLHNSSFTNFILHLKRKIQTSYTITKENMTQNLLDYKNSTTDVLYKSMVRILLNALFWFTTVLTHFASNSSWF